MRISRQLLLETVIIRDFTDSAAYGPVMGDPRSVRASVQPTTKVVIGPDSRQLRVDVAILIRPEDGPVRPESQISLGPSSWRVLECSPIPDHRRPSHYEILAATWTPGRRGGSGS